MVEKTDFSATLVILLLTSFFACVFFAIMAGFNLSANLGTLIYATLYAMIVALSMSNSLKILQYASIASAGVVSRAGTLIVTILTGTLLFGEKSGFIAVVRVVLMVAAVIFVFLDKRKSTQQTNIKNSPLLFAIYAGAGIIITTAATLLNKSFAQYPDRASDNVYFFYANLIMLAGVAAVLLAKFIKDPKSLSGARYALRPKYVLNVLLQTVLSDVYALINIMLLRGTEISWYTSVTAAVGIVLTVVSSLIFREKLGVYSYVATAICIAVVFI